MQARWYSNPNNIPSVFKKFIDSSFLWNDMNEVRRIGSKLELADEGRTSWWQAELVDWRPGRADHNWTDWKQIEQGEASNQHAQKTTERDPLCSRLCVITVTFSYVYMDMSNEITQIELKMCDIKSQSIIFSMVLMKFLSDCVQSEKFDRCLLKKIKATKWHLI